MSRGVFQATIVDEAGNVVSEPEIEVRDETSGELVQLYEDFEDGDELGNPFDGGTDGFFRLYVDPGMYRITATSGAFEREWRHVIMGGGLYSSTFTGTLSGMASSTTGDVDYTVSGGIAYLSLQSTISGTSNTAAMTMTGLPEALRPARTQWCPCFGIITHSSSFNAGFVQVTSAGGVTFYLAATTEVSGSDFVRGVSGSFASSGTKGLASGWMIAFPLT